MTTISSSTVLDQGSDAAFRVWGSENNVKMAAVGMVQTADTGQINWTTVTRAGVNTAAGYEIWRFADSTIFLKLEFGSGSAANVPQMWTTEGSGSNGTGTITGQLSTRATFGIGIVPASTVTSYTSRWCHVADAFSMSWKEISAAATSNGAGLVIGKTVDGSGGAITTGFGRIRMTPNSGGTISVQSVRLVATAVTGNDVITNVIVPGDPNTSSTASTGNNQAYQIPINVPEVLPFCFACNVLLSEATRGSTVLVAMVGSATRTYISMGQLSGNAYGPYTAGRYTLAMIYE